MNFLKGRRDGRYTLGSSSTVTAHNMEEQKPQGQQPQPYAAQPQYPGQEQTYAQQAAPAPYQQQQ